MHPFVNTAVKAARRAGDIISRARERLNDIKVEQKGQHDYVTEIDKKAEAAIIDIVRETYPGHGILAEESGAYDQQAETVWIIDPLDGTSNFMRDFPHYAVSIAIQHKGRIEHGVIYDPTREELFTATRGSGAQLDGKRMRVSQVTKLEPAMLGTGFPYHNFSNLDSYMDVLKELLPLVTGVRRAGAAALDLAYVAAGRLDGYWETKIQLWDMAAGALMVREAGGLVSDLKGGEGYLESGNIVAANPKLFKLLLPKVSKITG